MASKVRIGVIGAGGIFRSRHFPSLAKIDEAEIVAICNRSTESAAKIADEFNLTVDTTTDPNEVINRDDIDAVMIGTWPYKHCPLTLAALEAGKHVFVQARMAMNLREAKQMYSAALETGLVTQICPAGAWKGQWLLRRLVDEDYCGKIYNVYVRDMVRDHLDPDVPLHWRDIDRYSGLNALAMGITMERIFRIVGYLSTVTAHSETFIQERKLPDGSGTGPVERPDTIHVIGKLENGAEGAFIFSSMNRHTPIRTQIEIYGNEGTLIYDMADTILGSKAGDDGLEPIPIPEDEAAAWTTEVDFINAINGGPQGDTSFYEGLRYMEFTEAVARSAQLGQTMRLPLVST